MSNLNLKKDITVALNDTGEVIWTSDSTVFGGGDFWRNCREAVTIIIGDNVTSVSGAFSMMSKVRNIYVYNQNMLDSVTLYYEGRNMENDSDDKVNINLVNDSSVLNELFDYYDKDLFINVGEFLLVSDFGAKGEGDDTRAINNAIEFVVNNGGRLLFKSDATYTISKPIQICTPVVDETNSTVDKDFCIDFNHCRITVADGSTFNVNGALPDSMIYVNVNFADEEKMAAIQNVQLYPGIYQENNVYKPCAETGLYLASASQMHFENIKILDVTRGVYIPEKYGNINNGNISMDNIQISKSRTGATSLLDLKDVAAEYENNGYLSENLIEETDEGTITKPECKYVGIDCRGSDCQFSNIIVIDYLVGMRMLGENNDIYGAHIWNYYCPEQYKHSVCFINGGTDNDRPNTYTACVADRFHIGWLSSDTAEFKLINCHWLNKEVPDASYNESAYGFYIPNDVANSYGENIDIGSNINAVDCYMEGSDLDNDECFTTFCNRKDHSINYTGAIKNTFHAPIPEMQKFVVSENNIHDCENNSTINQIGKIKTKSFETANSAVDKFNIYQLHPEDFDFGGNTMLEFNGYGYIDNINYETGRKGTIYNAGKTLTTVTNNSGEINISIGTLDSSYRGESYISIDPLKLGYKVGDVCCVCFDYYTETESVENGIINQTKQVKISNSSILVDYFSGEGIDSIPLEESKNNAYKSFAHIFKFNQGNGVPTFQIGHGVRVILDEDNKIITDIDIKRNLNPIIIKNLRIIKIPSTLDLKKLPKYYLETEENYCARVANAFSSKNSIITKNDSGYDVLTIPAYQCHEDNAKLAFVSLPFKHTVTDNQGEINVPEYKLSYSKLGRPCFMGLLKKNASNAVHPEIYINYVCDSHTRLFTTADYVDPTYENLTFTKLKINDEVYGDINNYICNLYNNSLDSRILGLYKSSYFRNIDLASSNITLINKIILPIYNLEASTSVNIDDVSVDDVEKPYILTNFITNPYGYHFETPIDAEYDDSKNYEPIGVDIPLYPNGEICLMMKNSEYSTELPTFIVDIEYSQSQSETY